MRSIWKGHIRFSLVTIPIRLYNAIETSETISFKQIHKEDNGSVGYKKWCKKCNTEVPKEDIVKGFEYEADQYVIIEPDDLSKIRLKSTRAIDIIGFVDAKDVHPTLFDAPYYAGPENAVAAKPYALFAETLRKTQKLGVGKVVLRDRESTMLIGPTDNGLLLYKLRSPKEIRNAETVPMLEQFEVNEAELNLAKTLVDSLACSFEDLDLSDGYKVAVREMIEAKVQGQEFVSLEEAEEAPTMDILTALKDSIERSKENRPPLKAAPEKKDIDDGSISQAG